MPTPSKIKIKTVTAILSGKDGELASISFAYRTETFSLADVLAAIVKEDGSAWILGDGDTITIEDTSER